MIYAKAIRSNRYRGLQPKKCPLSLNFDDGVYKVNALNEADALQKALLMMQFINKNIQGLLSTQSKTE